MNLFKHIEPCLLLSFGVLSAGAALQRTPPMRPAPQISAFAAPDRPAMPVVYIHARRLSAEERRRDADPAGQASGRN